MQKSIYEIGDDLESLANKAREWFIINKVSIPSGAREWSKASVRRGELPPGTTAGSLRRYGFNVTAFLSIILNDPNKKPYNYNPITEDKLFEIGYKFISYVFKNGHKYITVRCNNCNVQEEITYGRLQEAISKNKKYCRYCRKVGGKEKPLSYYNTFNGFTIVSKEKSRLSYRCNECSNLVERTMAHFSSSEYIVCEHCYPRSNFGSRHYTEFGYFDSKVEYEAYKILLKYLDSKLIIRQKKYDDLFNTGTKHTADFYIPSLNLVLEVTTNTNNIGKKYKETAEWKKSISNCVKFAYSLSEVEDIVRSTMKIVELTAKDWRGLLCSSIKW